MLRKLLVVLIASFLALSREETAFSDPTVAVGTWVEVFGLDQNNLSDYLNVRDTTSLSGKENHHLYNDYVAYIDEGPVEAEGYRWWHLAGLGWAVDNWLRATSEEKIPKEPKGKILFVQHDSNSNTFWNLINSDGTNKENLMVFPFEACGPLDYAWAPDGKEVAFVTCEGTDENPTYLINKLNIETGEIVILISIDNEHPKSLSWSPDDKAIVFSLSNKEDSDYYSSGYEPRIYFLDLETLEVVEVPDTKGRFPDWSADGRKIVFSSGGDLFLVNKDGTGLTNLGVNPSGWASTPSWSPTGDKIVFTCNDVRRPYRYLDGTYICEVFADGTGLNKIVSDQTNLNNLPLCNVRYDSATPSCYYPDHVHPQWSPDGTEIVFNLIQLDENKYPIFSIFVIGDDGTNLRYLTSGANPEWQPTTVLQVPTVPPSTPTAIPPTPTQEAKFSGEESTPILLVHGCGGSAYDWEETGWVSGLSLVETYTDLLPFTEVDLYRAEGSIFAGSEVFSLDYRNSTGSLEETAQVIPRSLDTIKSVTAAEKVIIISHSMGAILTRYYLEDFLEERYSERSDVSTFLMLAPPNNGSFWINIGLKEMVDFLNIQCPQAASLNSEYLEPLNSKRLPGSVSTYSIAAGDQCWFIFIGFNDCVVATKDAKIDDISFTQYSAVHSDLLPLALEQAVFPELTPILEHEQTEKIALEIYEEVVK